jgi:hypothetical protein
MTTPTPSHLAVQRAYALAVSHGHLWAIRYTPAVAAAGVARAVEEAAQTRAALLSREADRAPLGEASQAAWAASLDADAAHAAAASAAAAAAWAANWNSVAANAAADAFHAAAAAVGPESPELDSARWEAANAASQRVWDAAWAAYDAHPGPSTHEQARACSWVAQTTSEWGGFLYASDPDTGIISHVTGTGRLTWVITPEGEVTLKVSRPSGPVLTVMVSPSGETRVTQSVPQSLGSRHVDTARWALRALGVSCPLPPANPEVDLAPWCEVREYGLTTEERATWAARRARILAEMARTAGWPAAARAAALSLLHEAEERAEQKRPVGHEVIPTPRY